MPNKLQELTDKLYNEGLSKGKEEGERILEDARAKASAILEKAESEAKSILEKAEKEAADNKSKAENDLKTATEQALQAVKKNIENLIVSNIVDGTTDKILSDTEFLKNIITTVAEKFSSEQASDIDLILPESTRKDLEPFIANEISKILKAGVTATFSERISGGFKIGPKDGSYFISLSDETFKELIGEYLRPATKKTLFG